MNDATSKPEKNLSVIFITIAVTISLTKKDNRPSVTMLSGSLRRKPIVVFRIPITSATNIAVVKFLILTEGIILATSSNTAALSNN